MLMMCALISLTYSYSGSPKNLTSALWIFERRLGQTVLMMLLGWLSCGGLSVPKGGWGETEV